MKIIEILRLVLIRFFIQLQLKQLDVFQILANETIERKDRVSQKIFYLLVKE